MKPNIAYSFLRSVALWLSLGFTALQAASVPWAGVLNTSNPITVPAGKILVIDHMCFNNTSANGTTAIVPLSLSGPAQGGIGSGTFAITVQYTVGGLGNVAANTNTLRVGPGMTLAIPNGYSYNLAVMGVALDTADFFASANPVLKGVSEGQGQVTAMVDSRTAAPVKAMAEVSADLENWSSAGVAVSPSATNPRVSRVTVPHAGAEKLFLRAKVIRRPVTVLEK